MTVAESHDIALALQHKLEGLKDVERAFVHVDHLTRDGLEHKVERELVQGAYATLSVTSPLVDPETMVSTTPSAGLRARYKSTSMSSSNMNMSSNGIVNGGIALGSMMETTI